MSTNTSPEQLITSKRAAELLGVSEAALRAQRCSGPNAAGMPPLPFIKLGRRVRYRQSDIERVITENLQHAPGTGAEGTETSRNGQ
jgi:predicted DNA-binding transcriptional regulator AlpA